MGFHQVVHNLEPVTGLQVGNNPVLGGLDVDTGLEVIAGGTEYIEVGELRSLVRGAHVGEYQTAVLDGRVSPVTKAVFEGAGLGLSGSFQNTSVDIEKPTVIAAADASLFNLPVLKGGAAVGAVGFHYAEPAIPVPKGDQLFIEPRNRHGQVGYLLAEQERVPEASEVFPHRGAGPDSRQFPIVLRHLVV